MSADQKQRALEECQEVAGGAVMVEVRWTDGLHHRWTFAADRTWNLELDGVPGQDGPMRIGGYKREDMERVLGTALNRTASQFEFGGDVFMPGQSPLDLPKESVLALLDDLRSWVDGDDSMEGSLAYEWHPDKPGWYRVAGVLRMGNSQGQGGVRLLRADMGPGT